MARDRKKQSHHTCVWRVKNKTKKKSTRAAINFYLIKSNFVHRYSVCVPVAASGARFLPAGAILQEIYEMRGKTKRTHTHTHPEPNGRVIYARVFMCRLNVYTLINTRVFSLSLIFFFSCKPLHTRIIHIYV